MLLCCLIDGLPSAKVAQLPQLNQVITSEKQRPIGVIETFSNLKDDLRQM